MAELLDDVIGEVLEYIQSPHHLVVVEGFRRSLAEKKNMLEHVKCGRADPGLKGSRFLMRVIFIFIFVLGLVSDGLFIRVNAPVMPSLSTFVQGLQTEHEASAIHKRSASALVSSSESTPLSCQACQLCSRASN
jgi:hypothetical protein